MLAHHIETGGHQSDWDAWLTRKLSELLDLPAAVIGASPGAIGTALAQQSLRAVLSYCNARQMTSPEAYIQLKPGLITDDGTITDAATEQFLRDFMVEFRSTRSGF